MITCSVFTLKR